MCPTITTIEIINFSPSSQLTNWSTSGIVSSVSQNSSSHAKNDCEITNTQKNYIASPTTPQNNFITDNTSTKHFVFPQHEPMSYLKKKQYCTLDSTAGHIHCVTLNILKMS